MPLCSVCGRREAVYLRISSGERLCARCLERSLARRVKRTLSRTRSIGPRDRILLPVFGSWALKSALMIRLVSMVEREYPSSLLVALEKGMEGLAERLEGLLAKPAEFLVLEASASPREEGSMLGCLRAARALSVEAARRIGAGIVMLPPPRDLFTALVLSSLARGDVGGMAEYSPVLSVDGVRVVYPFYDVEGEDLCFYAHVLGLYEWGIPLQGCGDELDQGFTEIVAGVAERSRELLFSAHRVSRLFSPRSLERIGLRRCSLCGGLDEVSPCRVCRRLVDAVRSLEVRPLP